MKQSDIKAGKTYRGQDGTTRHLMDVFRGDYYRGGACAAYPEWQVRYQCGKSDKFMLLSTFARWAVEEVGA